MSKHVLHQVLELIAREVVEYRHRVHDRLPSRPPIAFRLETVTSSDRRNPSSHLNRLQRVRGPTDLPTDPDDLE
ncbi:hypothetical protein C495_09220 [Natronorubrum sulfidifaciens JCM 14089]|uniref:Uncharacterized protein n=1 Tax=Natronorubrum sulfidifaciens JCM 14089 TaxID=1230460 RepID=L9W784_9EURY|nr:hypothetical protein C495_09220 [Natronorubrum sulfidifaciens JCM 14089]